MGVVPSPCAAQVNARRHEELAALEEEDDLVDLVVRMRAGASAGSRPRTRFRVAEVGTMPVPRACEPTLRS